MLLCRVCWRSHLLIFPWKTQFSRVQANIDFSTYGIWSGHKTQVSKQMPSKCTAFKLKQTKNKIGDRYAQNGNSHRRSLRKKEKENINNAKSIKMGLTFSLCLHRFFGEFKYYLWLLRFCFGLFYIKHY